MTGGWLNPLYRLRQEVCRLELTYHCRASDAMAPSLSTTVTLLRRVCRWHERDVKHPAQTTTTAIAYCESICDALLAISRMDESLIIQTIALWIGPLTDVVYTAEQHMSRAVEECTHG